MLYFYYCSVGGYYSAVLRPQYFSVKVSCELEDYGMELLGGSFNLVLATLVRLSGNYSFFERVQFCLDYFFY